MADAATSLTAASPIEWLAPLSSGIVPPHTARGLITQALSLNPNNPALLAKLGHLEMSAYNFDAAAKHYQAVLDRAPETSDIRHSLGYVLTVAEQFEETLVALDRSWLPEPSRNRAIALEALGRSDEAEAEYRAVLDAEPHDFLACRYYHKLLRRTGRDAAMLENCEDLYSRGVKHSQLLYNWGAALAKSGDELRAKALLFDPDHVVQAALPVPQGFDSIAEFNAALAEEILTNPNAISEFRKGEDANRGSSRVHALFAGNNPGLMRTLLAMLQQTVDALPPSSRPFDPWAEARPKAALLSCWGLIQRGDAYEEWHLHRNGWLSGVYYIRIPKSVSAEGFGGGCIEFGPPERIQAGMPDLVPLWRHAPQEGQLLLSPSHYLHRTIPSGLDEYRISFAFDVVPSSSTTDGA